MYIYLFSLAYLLFFLFMVHKNRGSLTNGFLFFILLLLCGLSLIRLTDTSGNRFLFYLTAAIVVLILLFLLLGVFILLLISFGSALILLKKEGRSLGNLLSLLLGVGILGWLALQMISFQNEDLNLIFSYFLLTVNTVLFYLLFLFSNYLLSAFVYGVFYPVRKQDYIIVLGSGLIQGERVSPLLAGRIDRAIKIYQKQVKRKNSPPLLLMSGGQGKNESLPESLAMKQYAVSCGIPEEHILVEDASKNTYENMLFSKQIIEGLEKRKKNPRILFSTTNYHVFRAAIYAKRVHLKARGIGSKTKFYFWYNALLREYAAILVMNKKVHLICMALLLVIVFSLRVTMFHI